MVRVHPRPGQSDQLLKTNVYNVNVYEFLNHQIYPNKSRQLHIMEESLVTPLMEFLILRRG